MDVIGSDGDIFETMAWYLLGQEASGQQGRHLSLWLWGQQVRVSTWRAGNAGLLSSVSRV